MVLGTFLSAPIMFVSSKMILVMKSSGAEVESSFFKALFDTGILSAICCVSYMYFLFRQPIITIFLNGAKVSIYDLRQLPLHLLFLYLIDPRRNRLEISSVSYLHVSYLCFVYIPINSLIVLLTVHGLRKRHILFYIGLAYCIFRVIILIDQLNTGQKGAFNAN